MEEVPVNCVGVVGEGGVGGGEEELDSGAGEKAKGVSSGGEAGSVRPVYIYLVKCSAIVNSRITDIYLRV